LASPLQPLAIEGKASTCHKKRIKREGTEFAIIPLLAKGDGEEGWSQFRQKQANS